MRRFKPKPKVEAAASMPAFAKISAKAKITLQNQLSLRAERKDKHSRKVSL